MNSKLNSKHAALAVCTVVLMTACGGDDDDPVPTPVTSAVPADAQTSSASATTYVAALAVVDAGTSDTLEPISALPDSLASDDTAEPATVN